MHFMKLNIETATLFYKQVKLRLNIKVKILIAYHF
jgi:hypothetical protein